MRSDPVRVGFVGVGAVAEMHARAYRCLPEVALVACCDTDPSRLRAFARQYDVEGYDDLARMLSEAAVEVVCVLTPARVHESAVIACAEAGVHVLCEKPLALTVDACDRMIRACEEANVALGYGASYRFLPALARAKELIDAGEIGEILVMRECAIGGSGSGGRHTLSAGHYPVGGPGGSGMGLIDHGIHLVDAFCWLTGSAVTRTVGRGNVAGREQLPEFLVLEFASGAIGELLYEDGTFPSELPGEGIFSNGSGWDPGGMSEPGQWQAHPGSIHVHGTRGSLRIFHYGHALFLRTAAGIRQIELTREAPPIQFTLQMRAFVNALREGKPVPVPAQAGREACRLTMSVYRQPA